MSSAKGLTFLRALGNKMPWNIPGDVERSKFIRELMGGGGGGLVRFQDKKPIWSSNGLSHWELTRIDLARMSDIQGFLTFQDFLTSFVDHLCSLHSNSSWRLNSLPLYQTT